MQVPATGPASPTDPFDSWVSELNHAVDWAGKAIPRWINEGQSWPPADEHERATVEDFVRTLTEAKDRWTRLASPLMLRRLTPQQRDALYSCFDYLELAGLRLRQAFATGDAEHLHDALGNLVPGHTYFRLVATTAFGLDDQG